MKTLIRFSREETSTSLETSKYLQNLTKSLNIAGIEVTNNLLDRAQIAHFISPVEEKQITDAYLEDLLVVISVGYCEGDEKHSFFIYKKNKRPTLSPRSIRILKQADLILVPTQTIKDYLLADGVEVRIEVVTAGVDVESFNKLDNTQNNFRKYVQLKEDRQYVLSHGHAELEGINSIINLANELPSIDFFYLVYDESLQGSISIAKKIDKKCPKNLHVSHIIPIDIYLSGIKGALAYLTLPLPTEDYLAIFDAMGAKTQVIYMDANKKHGIFVNRDNVLIAANEEKAQRLIWSLSIEPKKNTISSGYKFALANSLEEMGKQLKSVYESLLKVR